MASNSFACLPRRPLARGRFLLATLCFAFAPVDAIDVLGNREGPHLTPFLLMSALYIFLLAFEQITSRATGQRPPSLPHFDATFALAFFFVLLILASILFPSSDSQHLAFSRAVYAIWLIFFATLFVARENRLLPMIIARALRIFIVCDAIAVGYQILAIFRGWSFPDVLFGLELTGVSGIFRLSGVVRDPNRSSMVVILYMGLAFILRTHLEEQRRVGRVYYFLGVMLSLITLSRTGAVSLVILAAIPFMQSRNKMKVAAKSLLAIFCLGGLGIFYLASTKTLSSTFELAQLALVSSDQREESTSLHFQLVREGTDLFVGSGKIFLMGAGWGTEYEYTGKFFADSRYSNFHCQYVSIAVQTGILGLICVTCLLIRPLLLSSQWRLLVLLILWSCVFYQYQGEPSWWLIVFVMNSSIPAAPPSVQHRSQGLFSFLNRRASPVGT